MRQAKTILWVTPFIIGLVLIRTYEEEWFYDPFSDYFRGTYQNQAFPPYDGSRLFMNILFRYGLNTLLSLGIIQILFRKKEYVRVASFLYLVFFLLLLVSLFLILKIDQYATPMTLFYIRRFLIQPLFLLLFLPAFYLQSKITPSSNS